MNFVINNGDTLSTPEYKNAKQELEKLETELLEHNTSQFDSYEEDEELPQQISNEGMSKDDDLVLFNPYEYALLRPKRIDYTRLDDDEYFEEQINKPPKQPKKKRIGKSTLPKYTSDRKIHVIRSTKQLNFFCNITCGRPSIFLQKLEDLYIFTIKHIHLLLNKIDYLNILIKNNNYFKI